jgi:hypothetical protein
MSHKQQWDFCNGVKEKHPSYFKNAKVLDIGSFDVNGNEEFLFENCEFDVYAYDKAGKYRAQMATSALVEAVLSRI